MFNFFNLFNKQKGKHERPQEFSKTLLIQESLLIWIHSLSMLVLAYICVFRGYYAELPWLTAMSSLPWAAQAENTKDGIRYETVMAEYDEEAVG